MTMSTLYIFILCLNTKNNFFLANQIIQTCLVKVQFKLYLKGFTIVIYLLEMTVCPLFFFNKHHYDDMYYAFLKKNTILFVNND